MIHISRFFVFALLVCHSFPARATALHLDDPTQLQALEAAGFDFARIAFNSALPISDNKALSALKAYASLTASLEADLNSLKKRDGQLSPSMKSPHRLFDSAWLKSPYAKYELVGIVNRLDRAPFHPGSCGELRFIYRLAYKTLGPDAIYSRLPMTVNVVYWTANTGAEPRCAKAAHAWRLFTEDAKTKPAALNRASLPVKDLKSIEVNLQAVRWPSTVRPDMGGYAEYFLRVFKPNGGIFEASKLENTPDVSQLLAQPSLRAKLLSWIKAPANLIAIDEGIAVVPDEFLATNATSVALQGTHRLANAPYTGLFTEKDVQSLDFSRLRTVKSAHGLLKRLNDLSCVGCHQGRTVAGFHFLGRDREATDAVNAIAVSASPHFMRDQHRRITYFASVMAKEKPDAFRPFSVRAESGEGDFGSHCGFGDPSFQNWTCHPGLKCTPVIRDDRVSRTGVCLPATPMAGSICQPGTMEQNQNPHRDKVVLGPEISCGPSQHCEDTSVGFPGGMCSRGCDGLKDGETCGSIAVLHGFNTCLAKNLPFGQCLRGNVRPGALKACDETRFCRDDYICTKTATGGACIPPYFLFQLRVDGHPKPGA